ncbi:MAG: hypothetical protein JST00_46350 [Deltaproteobacteria bacterium]|nr:hypothetical protein [Deltaproteobacteria bacterium]
MPHREAPSASCLTTAKVPKAASKSPRPCAAHDKKAKSAWNQLRANLRHEGESQRMTLDEDDDDSDDPDLTTLSIWDDFNDDGSTSDTTARASDTKVSASDRRPDDSFYVSAIREARGHDGGMERPPRG